MELTYTKCGDYYIPDIALSNTADYQIGRYGAWPGDTKPLTVRARLARGSTR